MQELNFAIKEECLHSNLPAELPMHSCAHAKYAKKSKCSIHTKDFIRLVEWKISAYDACIFNSNIFIHIICLISLIP